MMCIMNSFKEYEIKAEKWIKQITKTEIENRKKEFCDLFQKLFVNENIQNKITNKFIEIFKENYPNEDLKKMNFMIIGASGAGKSTLINALLREDVAKEGMGGVCTNEIKKYESKNFPFLCLYDSVGAELGNHFTLKNVQNETINLIVEKLNNSDPNQHIHCIIYCVTFNRFYEEESEIILKIREKYDGKKLPIVIAYTMGNDNKKVNAVKAKINEFLKKCRESINDDNFNNFGINFLKIYSKEDNIPVNDKNYFQKCFGLSDLISICYKKGEQSYKIAIKNSLKQIAKKYLLNNVENISKEIENNSNLFSFLRKKFDPNFSKFISFLFEKLTNVENFKNIQDSNLHSLNENFNNSNYQEVEQNQNEISKILTNNNEYTHKCIFCSKKSTKMHQCCFCGSYACEDCVSMQISKYDIVQCKKSSGKNFEKIGEDKSLIFQSGFNKDNNTIKENNNEILFQNNLNDNSIFEINELIKIFKNEMLKIMKKNFDLFTEEQAEKIYVHILEKFNQNNSNKNINIQEAMKSKEQLKKEVIEKIKNELNDIAEENFLKGTTSLLFKDIIEIFKTGMINKIKGFVKNIEFNEEIQMAFKSFDFEPTKEIEIGKYFKEYIEQLKEVEKKSYEKSLKSSDI